MKNQAKKRYDYHKHNAKQRGIPFEMTFSEWSNWWEENLGSNWLNLRGRASDQFAMARLGDVGPYKLGNIKCVTARSNILERVSVRGIKHNNAKINDEIAAKIYLASGSYKTISEETGVTYTIVRDIKRGRTWTHVTKAPWQGSGSRW